ncbi:uncharacterized protein LOC141856948 isoform X2 [Brevipalpus obovatus]
MIFTPILVFVILLCKSHRLTVLAIVDQNFASPLTTLSISPSSLPSSSSPAYYSSSSSPSSSSLSSFSSTFSPTKSASAYRVSDTKSKQLTSSISPPTSTIGFMPMKSSSSNSNGAYAPRLKSSHKHKNNSNNNRKSVPKPYLCPSELTSTTATTRSTKSMVDIDETQSAIKSDMHVSESRLDPSTSSLVDYKIAEQMIKDNQKASNTLDSSLSSTPSINQSDDRIGRKSKSNQNNNNNQLIHKKGLVLPSTESSDIQTSTPYSSSSSTISSIRRVLPLVYMSQDESDKHGHRDRVLKDFLKIKRSSPENSRINSTETDLRTSSTSPRSDRYDDSSSNGGGDSSSSSDGDGHHHRRSHHHHKSQQQQNSQHRNFKIKDSSPTSSASSLSFTASPSMSILAAASSKSDEHTDMMMGKYSHPHHRHHSHSHSHHHHNYHHQPHHHRLHHHHNPSQQLHHRTSNDGAGSDPSNSFKSSFFTTESSTINRNIPSSPVNSSEIDRLVQRLRAQLRPRQYMGSASSMYPSPSISHPPHLSPSAMAAMSMVNGPHGDNSFKAGRIFSAASMAQSRYRSPSHEDKDSPDALIDSENNGPADGGQYESTTMTYDGHEDASQHSSSQYLGSTDPHQGTSVTSADMPSELSDAYYTSAGHLTGGGGEYSPNALSEYGKLQEGLTSVGHLLTPSPNAAEASLAGYPGLSENSGLSGGESPFKASPHEYIQSYYDDAVKNGEQLHLSMRPGPIGYYNDFGNEIRPSQHNGQNTMREFMRMVDSVKHVVYKMKPLKTVASKMYRDFTDKMKRGIKKFRGSPSNSIAIDGGGGGYGMGDGLGPGGFAGLSDAGGMPSMKPLSGEGGGGDPASLILNQYIQQITGGAVPAHQTGSGGGGGGALGGLTNGGLSNFVVGGGGGNMGHLQPLLASASSLGGPTLTALSGIGGIGGGLAGIHGLGGSPLALGGGGGFGGSMNNGLAALTGLSGLMKTGIPGAGGGGGDGDELDESSLIFQLLSGLKLRRTGSQASEDRSDPELMLQKILQEYQQQQQKQHHLDTNYYHHPRGLSKDRQTIFDGFNDTDNETLSSIIIINATEHSNHNSAHNNDSKILPNSSSAENSIQSTAIMDDLVLNLTTPASPTTIVPPSNDEENKKINNNNTSPSSDKDLSSFSHLMENLFVYSSAINLNESELNSIYPTKNISETSGKQRNKRDTELDKKSIDQLNSKEFKETASVGSVMMEKKFQHPSVIHKTADMKGEHIAYKQQLRQQSFKVADDKRKLVKRASKIFGSRLSRPKTVGQPSLEAKQLFISPASSSPKPPPSSSDSLPSLPLAAKITSSHTGYWASSDDNYDDHQNNGDEQTSRNSNHHHDDRQITDKPNQRVSTAGKNRDIVSKFVSMVSKPLRGSSPPLKVQQQQKKQHKQQKNQAKKYTRISNNHDIEKLYRKLFQQQNILGQASSSPSINGPILANVKARPNIGQQQSRRLIKFPKKVNPLAMVNGLLGSSSTPINFGTPVTASPNLSGDYSASMMRIIKSKPKLAGISIPSFGIKKGTNKIKSTIDPSFIISTTTTKKPKVYVHILEVPVDDKHDDTKYSSSSSSSTSSSSSSLSNNLHTHQDYDPDSQVSIDFHDTSKHSVIKPNLKPLIYTTKQTLSSPLSSPMSSISKSHYNILGLNSNLQESITLPTLNSDLIDAMRNTKLYFQTDNPVTSTSSTSLESDTISIVNSDNSNNQNGHNYDSSDNANANNNDPGQSDKPFIFLVIDRRPSSISTFSSLAEAASNQIETKQPIRKPPITPHMNAVFPVYSLDNLVNSNPYESQQQSQVWPIKVPPSKPIINDQILSNAGSMVSPPTNMFDEIILEYPNRPSTWHDTSNFGHLQSIPMNIHKTSLLSSLPLVNPRSVGFHQQVRGSNLNTKVGQLIGQSTNSITKFPIFSPIKQQLHQPNGIRLPISGGGGGGGKILSPPKIPIISRPVMVAANFQGSPKSAYNQPEMVTLRPIIHHQQFTASRQTGPWIPRKS